jgi:hypothetical protein
VKPATDGFEAQTTKPSASSVLHTRPRHSTRVTTLTGRPPSPPEPRSTRTSAVLTRSTRSLPCILALVDVPDVSYCGWSPDLLVPQSKPHVRLSLLLVHWHNTSLLELHLTVDHCLRAPHLHTTSQETCSRHG